MSWLRSANKPAVPRSGVVTVLDVGSNKVCCVVARLKPHEDSQLLRGRTQRSF